MIKVKQVLRALVLATFIFTSFSVSAQKVKKSNSDIIEVKQKLKKSMSLFVENTRPFYKEGMSFNRFKVALVGKGINFLPIEGEALLSKTFSYLENASSSKRIIKYDSGKEMAAALLFTVNHNKSNKKRNGVAALFGSSTGNIFPSNSFESAAACKWYQLGCWWNAVFGVYADDVWIIFNDIINP